MIRTGYVGPADSIVPSEEEDGSGLGFRGLYNRVQGYLQSMEGSMLKMLTAWGYKDHVRYDESKRVFFTAFGQLVDDMESLEMRNDLREYESRYLEEIKGRLFERIFKVLYGHFAGNIETDEQLAHFVNSGLERLGAVLVEDGFFDDQPTNQELLGSGKGVVRNQVFGSVADRFGGAVRNVLSDKEDAAILIGGEYGFLNKDAGVRDMVNALRRGLDKNPRRSSDESRVERQSEKGCAIVFIDLDKFKLNNDLCSSHAAGDQTLLAVAGVIKRKLRRADVKMRAGGEELVLYLDDVTMVEALKIAEGLRENIASVGMTSDYSPKFLSLYNQSLIDARRELGLPDYASASVGVSFTPYGEVPGRYEDLKGFIEDEIKLADGAMYGAKTNGRNGVVFVGQDGQLQKVTSITTSGDIAELP